MIPTRPQAASPPPNSALSTGWYIPPTPDSLGNPHSLPYNHYGQDDGVSNMVSASFPNFSSTVGPGAAQNAQDKQSLLANEKRRRRRESHNAVERRRRDNINEKITELATLIPECLLEGATPNGSSSANAASPPAPDELWGGLLKDESPPPGGVADVVPGNNNNAAGVIKANKGMILTKSVEYIRWVFSFASSHILYLPFWLDSFNNSLLRRVLATASWRTSCVESVGSLYRRHTRAPMASIPASRLRMVTEVGKVRSQAVRWAMCRRRKSR
ncbi:hypothetical protein BDZ89DRAFT_55894 [Hymenopellis radicata]|nr:hypothetical protein BDZ89DRAFT_55894 [Hymenopellis radicata]